LLVKFYVGLCAYSAAAERIVMDYERGGKGTRSFTPSVYCCIPVQTMVACVSQSKALVAADGYDVVITSSIRAK